MGVEREGASGEGEPTTAAKTAAVAKSELANPSCRPTATASAVTVAECDDGIPPEPTNCFASHRFSLYLHGARAADADPVREGESSDPGHRPSPHGRERGRRGG